MARLHHRRSAGAIVAHWFCGYNAFVHALKTDKIKALYTRKVLFYKMRLIVNIYWLWGASLFMGLDWLGKRSLRKWVNLRIKQRSTALVTIVIGCAFMILQEFIFFSKLCRWQTGVFCKTAGKIVLRWEATFQWYLFYCFSGIQQLIFCLVNS